MNNFHSGSTEFFKINLYFLHNIYTILTAVFFVEKQRLLPFIVPREKKCQSVQINLLAAGFLTGVETWGELSPIGRDLQNLMGEGGA